MEDSLLINVPDELFAAAESSPFDGEYSLPVLSAGPDEYRFAEPLSWNVLITNTGEALMVAGTVSGSATTSCARCLDEFSLSLNGEVEGYFLLQEDQEPPEDMDEDEYEVLSEDHVIDMEPLLVAALLLEVPLVPLCSEDCKGLCPKCGANLNEGPCDCGEEESEEDDFSDNPFSVLKDYPFDSDSK